MKKKTAEILRFSGPDGLVLEPMDNRMFRIVGPRPEWLATLFPGRFEENGFIDVADEFIFLESFLEDARTLWEACDRDVMTSEVWTQVASDGSEVHLVAAAACVADEGMLVIRQEGADWQVARDILQTAREQALEHERLVEAERRIAESDARLRLVLSHLPALVWTTDREQVVSSIYGSDEYLHSLTLYLKAPMDRLIGRSIQSLFPEESFDAPFQGAHRLAMDGIGVDFEFSVGRLMFGCHVEPMHAQDGSVNGLIGISRDLSAQKQIEDEKIFAAQREERARVAERHVRELQGEIAQRVAAESRLKVALDSLSQTLEGAILAMARALETRDAYTAGHQQRVAVLSREIARDLGMSEEGIHQVYLTALIHDLGKIAVPYEILGKPGTLTPTEFKLVQLHPVTGYEILSAIDFPWPVAKIVRQHHEHLDGSGYPDGLKSDQIMFESRIIAVADVLESVGSHRPYRPSMGMDAAFSMILDGRGTKYDPCIVDTCVRLFKEKGFTFS